MLGIIYDENRTRESVESDIAIRVDGWRATPRHSSATYVYADMCARRKRSFHVLGYRSAILSDGHT